MQNNQFEEALKALKERVDKSSGDKLAYLLEYATVLHQAGQYAESNRTFAEAEKIAELNDYTSLSREFGAILVQEGLIQYKVESFEYLMINVYRALNYIMLNDYENAQVMARRIHEKVGKIEVEKNVRKKHVGFANYLSGLLWESMNDWDNAFILYKKAYENLPEVEELRADLTRAAIFAKRDEDLATYKKQWPDTYQMVKDFKPKKDAEFIFIYQQGWIPRKQPRYDNHRFPMMAKVGATVSKVKVKVDDKTPRETEKIFDLDQVATQTLQDDYARLVAKKVAGIAAKAVIAHQMNKKNQGLGTLAFMALDAADQADLRQWSMLPASFQIAKFVLSPGTHKILITAPGADKPLWSGEVTLKKGQKHYFTLRTF